METFSATTIDHVAILVALFETHALMEINFAS